MKLLLLTLLLSAVASTYAGFFYDVEGCDSCCYPPPPDCCIPPAPVTQPPPPPTTSTPPDCPCVADVVIIMDRTGSVEPGEFNNVRTVVGDFLDLYADPDCFRTAALAFSQKAPAAYSLGDPAATDPLAAIDLIADIDGPSGQTNTGRALIGSRAQFKQNPPPTPRCRAILMITDGGSDDHADTLARADIVTNAVPDAKMCMVGMIDLNATDTQNSNRVDELTGIVAKFNSGEYVADVDFYNNDIPDTLLQAIADCVCDCIPPAPVTAPPPPPTTTPPPLNCMSSADVVFVFDRTGSVTGAEVTNAEATAKDVVQLLDDEGFECFRVAGVQFADKGETLFTFSDASAEDTIALLNVEAPSGDTDTGKGIIHARIALQNRGTPPMDDTCKVVILFTDGGSQDKPDTLQQAANLRDKTGARVCVVEMVDPGSTDTQTANRAAELQDIVNYSWDGSVIAGGDFLPGVPAGIVDKIFDCITDPCDGQPANA